MKKTLKLGFHSLVPKDAIDYYINLLQDRFHPEIADDYDYYIANEGIYWNKNNFNELLESDPDAIRIMGCGEAVYPDMNLFDYAIWHCGHYEADDRIIYDPLIRTEIGYLLDNIEDLDNSKNEIGVDRILDSKTKFCNFIYSNPRSHIMRDSLFYKISEYKHVDSLGSHLKNMEIEDTRNDINWAKISIDLKKPYKFSIAAENACFPGYTSEKIMSSMLANSIPIYWGDPFVFEQFNKKSFICVNDFDSLDEMLERIIEIDNNDDLYYEIMNEPWRTPAQIEKCYSDIDVYEKRLLAIFSQDKISAARRPRGCWPDMVYPHAFIGDKNTEENSGILNNIFKLFGRNRKCLELKQP